MTVGFATALGEEVGPRLLVALTLTRSLDGGWSWFLDADNCLERHVERALHGDKVNIRNVGVILSLIASRGYRLQGSVSFNTSSGVGHENPAGQLKSIAIHATSVQYIFERLDLPEHVSALLLNLQAEAGAVERVPESEPPRTPRGPEREEASQVANRRSGSPPSDCAQSRRHAEHAQSEGKSSVVVDRNAARARLAGTAMQVEHVKVPAGWRCPSPAVDEFTVGGGAGLEPLQRHIRVSCPGVRAEQISIECLSNGVGVRMRVSSPDEAERLEDSDGWTPIYERDFQYSDAGGVSELVPEDSYFEGNVLHLFLQQLPHRSPMKVVLPRKYAIPHGMDGRTPLVRVDVGDSESPLARAYPQVFKMTPSASQDIIRSSPAESQVGIGSCPSRDTFLTARARRAVQDQLHGCTVPLATAPSRLQSSLAKEAA